MLELSVKFLLSYFIGSVMGSMLVGRLRGGVDIRTMGSGNAGGTNALRTQGWIFALGVLIIDIGKGVLGAGVVPALDLPFIATDPALSRDWLTMCCAAAAVIGHVWPMWHSFRGGKGAATLAGTLAVLSPDLILPVLLVWAITLTSFGYVGLATMAAGAAAPTYLAATRLPEDQPLFIYCVAMALYIIFSHRSNLQRMRDGTESRQARLMLFRRQR
ncbi:MAG: glycerol-3-phosphate 1-O-acyltransferase PlsY [Proteobacteria bacterium]|nr:glycerol-3-phosphate 1-O-acyltransferase PlsY [Pseudomonadota bacterium]MCH8302432.1 glycerol-3-phosphate 1-O-acyltransferase PlsY [Pseudomonadota bacterium]